MDKWNYCPVRRYINRTGVSPAFLYMKYKVQNKLYNYQIDIPYQTVDETVGINSVACIQTKPPTPRGDKFSSVNASHRTAPAATRFPRLTGNAHVTPKPSLTLSAALRTGLST